MVQHGAVQTHGHWALYNQLDLGPKPGSSSCVTVGKGFTTHLSSPPSQSSPPPNTHKNCWWEGRYKQLKTTIRRQSLGG